MEFGGRVLERYLSHEGEAFMNIISVIISGDSRENSLTREDIARWLLSTNWEDSPYQEPNHTGTVISDF